MAPPRGEGEERSGRTGANCCRPDADISQQAGEEGHLFGSVTAKDIADALESKSSIWIGKDSARREFRQVGEYKVTVRLHREVTVPVTVNVVAE